MKNKTIIISVIILILIGIFIYIFLNKKEVKNYPSIGTDIIAFGDSLVEGVGADVESNFVALLSNKLGSPIINLGNSGDTTIDGLARIEEIDRYNPKVVILLLGGNDYLKKIPIETTRSNLSKIIENIQSRGSIVVLLGVRGGLISDPFKKMYKELSKEYKTAYVSDVLDGLIGNTNYMSDAIHPNKVGYEKISNRIYPVLSDLVK